MRIPKRTWISAGPNRPFLNFREIFTNDYIMDLTKDVFDLFPGKFKRKNIVNQEPRRESIEVKEISSLNGTSGNSSEARYERFDKNFKSSEISKDLIGNLSVLLKGKCGISAESSIQKDISENQDENLLINKYLSAKEAELKQLKSDYQADTQLNSCKIKELTAQYDKLNLEQTNCIYTLKKRLEYLSKVANVFQECFLIHLHKEGQTFICSTYKEKEEFIFSFTQKKNYTTYAPVHVNFPTNHHLNNQIEDMNRAELNLLFMRLLKIIYNI